MDEAHNLQLGFGQAPACEMRRFRGRLCGEVLGSGFGSGRAGAGPGEPRLPRQRGWRRRTAPRPPAVRTAWSLADINKQASGCKLRTRRSRVFFINWTAEKYLINHLF